MNTVTTADNEEMELHKASKAISKDLQASSSRPVERRLQKRWRTDYRVRRWNHRRRKYGGGEAGLQRPHHHCNRGYNSSDDQQCLPSTAGTQDDNIQESNNFFRDECRDTGVRFVHNNTNVLFHIGFCGTSSFKSDGICLSDSEIFTFYENQRHTSIRYNSAHRVYTNF